MENWEKKITYLASLHREKPLEMTCSAEATQTIRDFWQYMVDAQDSFFGENDALYAWASKAHGKAARIAAILTLLENPDARELSLEAAQSAVALMKEYFNPHAVRAFCGERKLSQPAESILKVIKAAVVAGAAYIKHADLRDKLRKQKQFKGPEATDVFSKGMSELLAAGYVRNYYLPYSPTGRPNDGAYALNPALVKGMKRPAGSPPLPGQVDEALPAQPVQSLTPAPVQTSQPKRTGNEMNEFLPQYCSGPKSIAEALEAMQQDQEDDGLPF